MVMVAADGLTFLTLSLTLSLSFVFPGHSPFFWGGGSFFSPPFFLHVDRDLVIPSFPSVCSFLDV